MRRERRAIAFAVLAVLLVTAVAFVGIHDAERDDERQRLDDAAASLASSVTAELTRMADLGIDVGVAAARLDTLDAAAYEALLDDLGVMDRFAGLAGVSFVSHVPRERLGDYLDQRTAEGDDFELLDDAGEDRLRVISYVYPRQTNLRALGVDLTSRPESRATADRAVATDAPALSSFSQLVQMDLGRPGVSLHVPARDLAGRLLGTVGVVVAMEPFVQQLEPLASHLEVRVVDPAATGPVDEVRFGVRARDGAQSTTVSVETGGQTWRLQVTAAPGFSPPWTQRGSTYVALGGLIIAIMIGLLAGSLASRERVARALVEQRTAELSEVNDQLASANRALAAANRTKDEFLASVSHELRTPLTVISGFVESLERMHRDQRSVTDLLEPIQRNVRRLDGLVSDLLTLASLDAGAITPVRTSVELSAVLRTAPRELAGLTDDEVVLDVPPDLRVAVDPRHLERVLINLLVNAARHGEPPVELAARDRGDGTVEFSIRDHGEGIDQQVVDRVFERFARGPQAGRTAGTGLGLAIVQELIEINGGSVEYQPAEPGARFVVRLSAAHAVDGLLGTDSGSPDASVGR